MRCRIGDDDIHAAFQIVFLFAVTNATMNNGLANVGESAVVAKGSFNLRREFARWLEHETPKFSVLA